MLLSLKLQRPATIHVEANLLSLFAMAHII